jgi:primosomal protein N' (replication factor Y)
VILISSYFAFNSPSMKNCFADIILPLAIRGRFTYRIPESLSELVSPGVKVLVQFGNKKIYSGIVCRVHNNIPSVRNIREILEVSSDTTLINENQLRLWSWMSEYYMCNEGEVLKAAVPSALFPEGEKSAPVREIYKPKKESFIRLARQFTDEELNGILDDLRKAPRQAELLTAYLHRTGYTAQSEIKLLRKSLVLKESRSTSGTYEELVKKGVLSSVYLEIGRLKGSNSSEPLCKLNNSQLQVFRSIKESFKGKDIVLLHGVTSSGKTEIYIHLIEEQLKLGKQVLYMLPEIALTAQIIIRLQKHFGKVTGIYHSRFSDQEKAEIWKKVAEGDSGSGYRLVLGVRSSLFLPFRDLGLIIVDEEHDGSYKQHDPAPRYHARDTAIMLAGFHNSKTLLGSATPSVESFHNASTGKYGLAELKERFGMIKLPAITIANTREAYRKKLMVSHFTPELINAIDAALCNKEQVILFQNRRGFSPYIECPECGWIPVCNQCDVNLTYHKGINRIVCHYCGYSSSMPTKCSKCGSTRLVTRGFGTEKIEDEIKIVFPGVRVARMDQDSTRNKNSFERLINSFEEGKIDIMIGTQMISKGLDFENLMVVGVLNADNLLNYPDFRAHERSFQMLEQVSGRAGRRKKEGKVIIQTSDPDNKIIRLVLRHDYLNMYMIQTEERMTFNYPPFCRMIKISLKHKNRASLNAFSEMLGNDLKGILGKGVLGPEFPVISQIQLWYIKNILIKLEKEKPLAKTKEMIREAVRNVENQKGAASLKIAIDVDPY